MVTWAFSRLKTVRITVLISIPPVDVIGTSVNSLEMCMLFTQAMVANVATMANWLVTSAKSGGHCRVIVMVELGLGSHGGCRSYNVYKNNEPSLFPTRPILISRMTNVENFTPTPIILQLSIPEQVMNPIHQTWLR